jgi:hypothetical protein
VVPFCERHAIVGLGWEWVDHAAVAAASRTDLFRVIQSLRPEEYNAGSAASQLHRFAQECELGDYVVYYDPAHKRVRVCRVTSEVRFRDFDLEDRADVWHYRTVEYPIEPIPVVELGGSLKGGLLGPRMSFWSVDRALPEIEAAISPPPVDHDLLEAHRTLTAHVVRQAEALNDRDWELLVVDWFRAHGAQVDDSKVGGSRPIIDAEARFDHGELGVETWRAQVKRFQDRPVGWADIDRDRANAGDSRFCFVSVFGFTEEARRKAAEADVRLLEAADFTRFLLGGRLRPELRAKLRLPFEL